MISNDDDEVTMMWGYMHVHGTQMKEICMLTTNDDIGIMYVCMYVYVYIIHICMRNLKLMMHVSMNICENLGYIVM
jgi:hypothetical protein